jgi:hypothetical protein
MHAIPYRRGLQITAPINLIYSSHAQIACGLEDAPNIKPQTRTAIFNLLKLLCNALRDMQGTTTATAHMLLPLPRYDISTHQTRTNTHANPQTLSAVTVLILDSQAARNVPHRLPSACKAKATRETHTPQSALTYVTSSSPQREGTPWGAELTLACPPLGLNR